MPRLELEGLLRNQVTTQEQDIFISWFYSQFDYSSPGINRHIANVEPIFFQGAIAGSEFLVYAATKLYLALEFSLYDYGDISANFWRVELYDEANNVFGYAANHISYYNSSDATQHNTGINCLNYNLYFSRIIAFSYRYMKIIGYRITLT